LAEIMAFTSITFPLLHLQSCLDIKLCFRVRVLDVMPVTVKSLICVRSFDILLFYYLPNVKLYEILKFGNLPASYSLALKYMICKHDSRL
jgi:hypothetical protein